MRAGSFKNPPRHRPSLRAQGDLRPQTGKVPERGSELVCPPFASWRLCVFALKERSLTPFFLLFPHRAGSSTYDHADTEKEVWRGQRETIRGRAVLRRQVGREREPVGLLQGDDALNKILVARLGSPGEAVLGGVDTHVGDRARRAVLDAQLKEPHFGTLGGQAAVVQAVTAGFKIKGLGFP